MYNMKRTHGKLFLSSIYGLHREAILIYNSVLVVWSKMITCSWVVDIWEPLWPTAAVLLFSLTLNTESLPLLFHCHCLCFFGHNLFSTCWSSPTSFSKSVNSVFSHNSPASFFFGGFPFLSISLVPPSCPAFYSAAPLTSAGIIPIMQSLCPDGQRDEFGFLQYKNST